MTFDPLADERVAPNVFVPRGDNGNPLIVPRGETEPEEYTRASGLADYLTRNVHHLKRWEMRYLAQGLGRNPDLAAWAATQHYSTGVFTGTQPISERQRAAKQLDEIIDMALERVGIHESANAGSVVHAATEPGAPEVPLPPILANAVREYHKLTAGLERVASEVFVVCDELRAGGTFDSGYMDPDLPGCVIIGDTKTGKNYHQAEFEIQLAIYSRGEIYLGPPKVLEEGYISWAAEDIIEDKVEHQRLTHEEYFGVPANQDIGYLVHVPLQGKPKPRIVELDLQRGWRLAQSAARTRDDQKLLDTIGIGKKVNHNAKAIKVMQAAWEELIQVHHERTVGFGERHIVTSANRDLVEGGRALYRRFSHIWPKQYTDEINRRLS